MMPNQKSIGFYSDDDVAEVIELLERTLEFDDVVTESGAALQMMRFADAVRENEHIAMAVAAAQRDEDDVDSWIEGLETIAKAYNGAL